MLLDLVADSAPPGHGGRGLASGSTRPRSAITGSSPTSAYVDAMAGGTERSASIRCTDGVVEANSTNRRPPATLRENRLTARFWPPSAEIVPAPEKVGSGAMPKAPMTLLPSPPMAGWAYGQLRMNTARPDRKASRAPSSSIVEKSRARKPLRRASARNLSAPSAGPTSKSTAPLSLNRSPPAPQSSSRYWTTMPSYCAPWLTNGSMPPRRAASRPTLMSSAQVVGGRLTRSVR